MCPFRFFYHVLLFLLSNALLTTCLDWRAEFDPAKIELKTGTKQRVHLVLSGLSDDAIEHLGDREYIQIKSEHVKQATVEQDIQFSEIATRSWGADFVVNGVFLGFTEIFVEIKTPANGTEKSDERLDVTVLRPQRIIDRMFTYSVIILVSILYINFGAAINLTTIKDIMRKPVGPIICFVCQFLFMPLVSYGLGFALFPEVHEMALGLFFTGISPGGGASNMWTLLLGGNIHLSIAMTTISTLAAFAMMPLWIFTLGKTIFERANLGVPYARITSMAAGLVIPLAVGLLIQRFMPKTTKFLIRIMKPLSFILILFIVIFAIITNLYIFELFSWQIIMAGLGLPWLGYAFGYVSSRLFKQAYPEAIAIAIETGIQNTGIAIYLLTFSLDQPMADLTTVIPVAVAIMTPLPLLSLYFVRWVLQFRARRRAAKSKDSTPLDSTNSTDHFAGRPDS